MKGKILLISLYVCSLIAVFSAGCGTIKTGKMQIVAIDTRPTSATVFLDGEEVGKSRIVVNVAKNQNHSIKCVLDGHYVSNKILLREYNKWSLCNLFIDLGTFSHIYDLVYPGYGWVFPSEVEYTLTKKPPPPPPPPPASGGNKLYMPIQIENVWIIIIGIGKYADPAIESLPYARKDAEDVKQLYESSSFGGRPVNIITLTDEQATKEAVMDILEGTLTRAGNKDMIVLYWAGHGYYLPDNPKKVFFACYDTSTEKLHLGYRMEDVRRALGETRAHNKVYLVDTCHAAAIVGTSRDIDIEPNPGEKIPEGDVFIMSASKDRKAFEPPGLKNGAFTHYLLRGLKGEADGFDEESPPDGKITYSELEVYMKKTMPEETQKILGKAIHPEFFVDTANPYIRSLRLFNKK